MSPEIKIDYALKEGGQKGRRQAMTRTFMRLRTRPEEYRVEGSRVAYQEITNCQLCGAALEYHFDLVHVQDPDFKLGFSLKVGSDCIYNFAKIYMPTQAEQLLITMKKAIENNKITRFRQANPEIFSINKRLLSAVQTQGRVLWIIRQHPLVKNFLRLNKELTRQEYLSGPKLEQFKSFTTFVEEGGLETAIKQHQDFKVKNLKIKDCYTTDQAFYDHYLAFAHCLYHYNFVASQELAALSPLEQLIARDRIQETLKKLDLTAWLTHLCEHWSFYTQLLALPEGQTLIPVALHRMVAMSTSEIARYQSLHKFKPTKSIKLTELTKKLPGLPLPWRAKITEVRRIANHQQETHEKRKTNR